jgi:DNA-binding response OmpR family regulator
MLPRTSFFIREKGCVRKQHDFLNPNVVEITRIIFHRSDSATIHDVFKATQFNVVPPARSHTRARRHPPQITKRTSHNYRAPPQNAACFRGRDLPYDTGMRLLLVEDDARIARFVAKGLREESYAVDVVENGNDAVYQTEINDYDLIVLDVMIPGMDGFAVCKSIRAGGKRTPILMLTAKDGVDDRIKGLDSGADDYLTKPFEFRELLARLRALLRRPNELRPPRIVVGDLELDTASQTAKRGTRSIPLTAKEYALLEYFARNAGRVIGRSEIAEHVWDETFDPFSNLIEVYVNRLRRKLGEEAGKPLLQTRRGSGYVLCDNEAPGKKHAAQNPGGARKSHV